MLFEIMIDTSWIPPYNLRFSNRAQNLNLKICPRKGFEVIVPPHFNLQRIPEELTKHRRWIEKHWKKIKPDPNYIPEPEFPEIIKLQAIDEIWTIEYQASDSKELHLFMHEAGKLVLQGNTKRKNLVKKALQHWVQHYAKQKLLPRLAELSAQSGLSYSQATIRNADTLWGSCNVKKRISLNCKLLFLPASLMDYVILHELCHTVHLNHSKYFWNLLAQFSPSCFELRKQLRASNSLIPAWFY